VLALEASTPVAGAALLGPSGEPWGAWAQAPGLRGTAHLAVAAGALLAARGMRPAELLGVVVGTGPGSYTGTRAAIALARGLALPDGLRLAGVPSPAAAARAALRADPRLRHVVVLIDARRGECYRADYERAEGPAGVIERRAPCLVSDADATPAQDQFVSVIREPLPDAYDVAAVGRERLLAGGDDPATVLPLYLKRSHAEIVFDERDRPPGLG
jgi:tRNA threonylcarbamoyl adenosine modification protein YeaZ